MATASSGLSGLAQRYGSALFELADKQQALDSIARDLGEMRTMIADSADLRQMLQSPALSRGIQEKAILSLAERAGFHGLTRNLFGLLARNRRLFALPAIITAFLDELAARRGEVAAEVTVAREPTAEQRAALEDVLKREVGSNVAIDMTIDPALLGGMIVKVGSRMFDSSLRSKLQRLQIAMKGVG